MLQLISEHKGSIIRELYIVLGQNYSNGSIVSVDMDVVGVMAAYLYLPVVLVCTAQSTEALSASLDCAVHTSTTGKCAAITPTTPMSTDTIEPLL
jgi:hypothetical protein